MKKIKKLRESTVDGITAASPFSKDCNFTYFFPLALLSHISTRRKLEAFKYLSIIEQISKQIMNIYMATYYLVLLVELLYQITSINCVLKKKVFIKAKNLNFYLQVKSNLKVVAYDLLEN